MRNSISGLHNLFSLASRERCITNLKNIRLPNPGNITPQKSAAVLVLMCRINNITSLLYTVRAANLKTDSGEISFPGGKCNKNESAIQTALRETEEEIGLQSANVDIWGQGPSLPSRKNQVMVTPVIGCLADLRENDLNINVHEVTEVFTVPLSILCDTKNQFYTQFKSGFILPVYLAEEYKIWGLTAYITHMFLSSLLTKDVYRNEFMKKKIEFNE